MDILSLILILLFFALGLALGYWLAVRRLRAKAAPAAVAAAVAVAMPLPDALPQPAPVEAVAGTETTLAGQPTVEEAPDADDKRRFAEKLLALIDERMDQRNLQVDMLASEMAMSHTLFYERVHQAFDDSPAMVLRRRRLARARELLATGRCSVSEVAMQCGFADAKYFSTVFKKCYGVSPSKVQA